MTRRSFLDPRTKLLLVLMLALFVLGQLGGMLVPWIKPVLSAVPFVLLLIEKKFFGFLRGVFMLGVGYGCLALQPHLTGVPNFLALLCGGFFTRFVATLVMGEYLISTTSVSEFIAGMERLRFPAAFTIPITVMFRFFPTIWDEWKSIHGAMSMRGIHLGGIHMAKIFEYQIVPMICCCARIGEELSMASLSRGLDIQVKRTNICQIGFRAQDYIVILFCLAIIISWVAKLI